MPLTDFFKNIRDVPRDGSCFYHCCLLWLFYTGQPFVGNVGQFRNSVYRHFSRVLTTTANDRPFRNAISELLPDFQGLRRTVMSNVGSGIWNRHHDFNRSVGVEHFCDVYRHIPIMAHYLGRDMIVYNTSDQTTTIFHYNDVTNTVQTLIHNDG